MNNINEQEIRERTDFLSSFIIISDERNSSGRFGLDAVRGIATSKVFIPTKANMDGVSLLNYKVVKPQMFAYVPDTSRRGDKISLAFNDSHDTYLVSSISTVFGVDRKKLDTLMPEYLYMFFRREEFDRYARYNSWGSARETFSWEDFCATKLSIPSHAIQRRLVDIYLGIQENLDAMTRGVEQMQRTCDAYMEMLIKTMPKSEIGSFIHPIEIRNSDLTLGIDAVRGISNAKEIMSTKASVKEDVIEKFYVIRPTEFIYNPRTTRMGEKVGLAYNDTDESLLFSFNNLAFAVNDDAKDTILPEYLFLFFRRSEFDRFARINSWGSATELFLFDDLGRYKIPVPPVGVQQDIVNIFNAYNTRRQLVDKLADLQKKICPILIKGATEGGGQ